jgi:hypothetical protein
VRSSSRGSSSSRGGEQPGEQQQQRQQQQQQQQRSTALVGASEVVRPWWQCVAEQGTQLADAVGMHAQRLHERRSAPSNLLQCVRAGRT